VPGVPNTTGKTQETDQNYGPFKSKYRSNIRQLSQRRFEKKLPLAVIDLPLLVFGGECPSTGVILEDAFTAAFSIERNLSCWRKCGAIPLTREPLKDSAVRREIPVGAAAALAPSTEDEQLLQLKQIEALNGSCCDILSSAGFDGDLLRNKAPWRITYVAVTAPQSEARIKAIKDAKTAGQLFFATGGRHINTNEFFQAKEIKRREELIAKAEEAKKQRKKYCQDQVDAVQLIRSKGELTLDSVNKFTNPEIKTLLRWKKVKLEAGKNRKKDLVEAYVAAPKPMIQKIWSRSEEATLLNLKNTNIPMRETATGIAATQMARAVTNNLTQCDAESLAALKAAIQDLDDKPGDPII
jgi:hypothetical protein